MSLLYWRGLSTDVPVPLIGSDRVKPRLPPGVKTGSSAGMGMGAVPAEELVDVWSMSWSRNWPQTHIRLLAPSGFGMSMKSPLASSCRNTVLDISRGFGRSAPAMVSPPSG